MGSTAPLGRVADRRILAGVAAALVQVVLGVGLIVAGVAIFFVASPSVESPGAGILATAAIAVGLVNIFGPWWWRLTHDLSAERQERIRSQERERRAWLYGPPEVESGESLAAALQRVSDEIEDLHGVAVETVEVGDCPVDERLVALVSASREALANAARHSGAACVSVYFEVEPDQVTVFVRDRGRGFELEQVPRDRRGIADSILWRMDRHGGKAVVRSEPGQGTEVELVMPR